VCSHEEGREPAVFVKMGGIMVRSQLDAKGRVRMKDSKGAVSIIDLKTRATIPIRLVSDACTYEHMHPRILRNVCVCVFVCVCTYVCVSLRFRVCVLRLVLLLLTLVLLLVC